MTTNDITTTMQLLRRTLLASAEVQAIVSGRVYLEHFYDYENANGIMPMIILDPRGGRGGYNKAFQRLSVDVYCYDKESADVVQELYDLVYQAIQCVRFNHDSVTQAGYAYEVFRPLAGYNNFIKAYYRRGTFAVLSAG